MLFPLEFIELQFFFALRVSEILSIPFIDALFEYTSIPVRVGVPFSSMSKEHKNWIEFSRLVKSIKDVEAAYQYHVNVMKDAPPLRMQFGCFSYDYLADEKLVKLHFANNDTPNPGALSDERIVARLNELKQMFQDIYENYPQTTEVVSSSWLFNINSFKRLFPEEFFQSTSLKWDFRSLGIWGQFIDKYGNVKQDLVMKFKKAMAKAITEEELKESFPLKDIKCWSYIQCFFDKYEIKNY